MSKQRMVSKSILNGNRLGGVVTTVGSLQLGEIILGDQDRRLLTQIRDRDDLGLTRDSQVGVVLNMKNLRVELLGEDIQNLPPLGGSTTKITVVVQVIILPILCPDVCGVGGHTKAMIVVPTDTGQVLPAANVV